MSYTLDRRPPSAVSLPSLHLAICDTIRSHWFCGISKGVWYEEHRLRRFLCFDLLTGRVTAEHPLFPWLVRHGASVSELAWIAEHAVTLDIIGLNFYPQWSTELWYLNDRVQPESRVTEPEGDGFAELLRTYWERYRAPVMITETSAFGEDEIRMAWLRRSVGTVKQLRGEGVPIVGYTWFPLTTMIDWAYRTGKEPLDRYWLELGLYRLGGAGGNPRWHPTPLVAQFADYVADPAAIGSFRAAAPAPAAERTR